jgi:hypothetical protein
MIRQLSLAVVGVDFPNRKPRTRGLIPRRFEIAACRPGEPVLLEREPDNPADPRAVMVFSERRIQLGYLTAERCGWIGGMIAQGREIRAVFQCATDGGALIRVTLDGSEPQLPTAAESTAPPAEDDFGFYPDYLPPDD